MLPDQFDQLLFTIFAEGSLVYKTFICISSGTYKRNLGPGYNTVFIHQVVHIGSLRVVCQADGIDSHFAHQCHIFFVMLRAECIAYFCAVLMATDSMKRQVFAIQKESFIRIGMIIAQS